MFLFDRWLGETHSLSGRNDEKKNLFLCPESCTGGSIRWPVLILTENSTSDMWFYYFYTALFVWVHFPIAFSIIIIIIIAVIASVIVLLICTPLLRFTTAFQSVRNFFVVNFAH
jgi:hypothetical protein